MEVDWDAALRAQLESLPTGKRVFNPPDRMREGANTRVEFRVSRGDLAALLAGLQGPGAPEVGDIRVAPLMAASLRSEEEGGEPVFRIKPLNDSDEQLVIGDQATEWSWDVFPTRTGRHRLYLSVSVLLVPPGGGPRKRAKVEERAVTVTITAYTFAQYWGTLVTLLAGGLGVCIVKWIRHSFKKWREGQRSRIIRP
jgi:hypothetical protein